MLFGNRNLIEKIISYININKNSDNKKYTRIKLMLFVNST